jgi:hypothetical protein
MVRSGRAEIEGGEHIVVLIPLINTRRRRPGDTEGDRQRYQHASPPREVLYSGNPSIFLRAGVRGSSRRSAISGRWSHVAARHQLISAVRRNPS